MSNLIERLKDYIAKSSAIVSDLRKENAELKEQIAEFVRREREASDVLGKAEEELNEKGKVSGVTQPPPTAKG